MADALRVDELVHDRVGALAEQDLGALSRHRASEERYGCAEHVLAKAGGAASRCYDADMAKVRTTLTLEEDVLRSVKVRAARQGKGDSQVIEESLRRDLGLDLLERLWDKNRMDDDDAMRLAVEAQHRTRRRRRT